MRVGQEIVLGLHQLDLGVGEPLVVDPHLPVPLHYLGCTEEGSYLPYTLLCIPIIKVLIQVLHDISGIDSGSSIISGGVISGINKSGQDGDKIVGGDGVRE